MKYKYKLNYIESNTAKGMYAIPDVLEFDVTVEDEDSESAYESALKIFYDVMEDMVNESEREDWILSLKLVSISQ